MTLILALLLAGEPLVTTQMADPDPGFKAPKVQHRAVPKRTLSPEEEVVRAALALELDRRNKAAAQQREFEQQIAEAEETVRASIEAAEKAVRNAEAAAASAPRY